MDAGDRRRGPARAVAPLRGTVLAVDLGGSSLRCALVGPDGALRALHAVPHESGIEADPEAWWRGVVAGAAALRETAPVDFAALRAIAVSAFTRSLVLLDAARVVLRPAMLWGDTRAEAVLPDLRARVPAAHAEAPHLNAFHPLARLFRLARDEPEVIARVAVALEPKDEINRRLTGVVATDAISSARLLGAADVLPALGLPALLPELRRPREVLGAVQPGLPGALGALAGLPVMAMAHDTWAAVAGLGALRPGVAYCISGTTEVLGLLGTQAATAPGLMALEWDGLWQLGGPSQHGADVLAWLASLGVAAPDPPPADPLPLLFLPTLAGERVPHWDPALRGAFLGLRRDHRPADVVSAAMQGVALNNRTVLERAEAAMGLRAAELRLGGGGATPGWARIRADVLGRPVVLTEAKEPGLLGCAVVAFAALEGLSLEESQRLLVREAARLEPDPARHAMASRLHALFLQAEAAAAPLSRALAGFT